MGGEMGFRGALMLSLQSGRSFPLWGEEWREVCVLGVGYRQVKDT